MNKKDKERERNEETSEITVYIILCGLQRMSVYCHTIKYKLTKKEAQNKIYRRYGYRNLDDWKKRHDRLDENEGITQNLEFITLKVETFKLNPEMFYRGYKDVLCK